MKSKDQLIEELEKLKYLTENKGFYPYDMSEPITKTIRLINRDQAISTIKSFLKDYKLVKKKDLLTELDISSIKRLEGFFPDGVWGQYMLKKLKSLGEANRRARE